MKNLFDCDVEDIHQQVRLVDIDTRVCTIQDMNDLDTDSNHHQYQYRIHHHWQMKMLSMLNLIETLQVIFCQRELHLFSVVVLLT